jgi:hypothetical protein
VVVVVAPVHLQMTQFRMDFPEVLVAVVEKVLPEVNPEEMELLDKEILVEQVEHIHPNLEVGAVLVDQELLVPLHQFQQSLEMVVLD